MRNVNHSIAARAHREAREEAPLNSNREQLTKGLHHNDKQERRQRVTLSNTTRAAEETRRGAIHQNQEMHRRDTMRYPRTPSLPKATSSQHIQ